MTHCSAARGLTSCSAWPANGNDVVKGGSGNDRVLVWGLGNTVDGGSGTDTGEATNLDGALDFSRLECDIKGNRLAGRVVPQRRAFRHRQSGRP